MMFTATPYTLSRSVFLRDPMATLARGGRHVVEKLEDYDLRPAVEADVADAHDACERLWVTYQNIDEGRRTPDGGRSLMTGDMALVLDGEGVESWWICCSIGWKATIAPGGTRVEVNADARDDDED